METAVLSDNETELLDRYVAELTKLSPLVRLELIARLSRTLQSALSRATQPTSESPAWLEGIAGGWREMPGTAEEISEQIRSSRTFNRPEVSLD